MKSVCHFRTLVIIYTLLSSLPSNAATKSYLALEIGGKRFLGISQLLSLIPKSQLPRDPDPGVNAAEKANLFTRLPYFIISKSHSSRIALFQISRNEAGKTEVKRLSFSSESLMLDSASDLKLNGDSLAANPNTHTAMGTEYPRVLFVVVGTPSLQIQERFPYRLVD